MGSIDWHRREPKFGVAQARAQIEAEKQFTMIGPFEILITKNVTLITTINHNLTPARAAKWLAQVVMFLEAQ